MGRISPTHIGLQLLPSKISVICRLKVKQSRGTWQAKSCHVEEAAWTCKHEGFSHLVGLNSVEFTESSVHERKRKKKENGQKLLKKRNMEEIKSSLPLTAARSSATKRNQEKSASSRIKKECLFFATSLQEGFQYVKALFIGLAKKATARNEKEATKADLQTAKMQVEAADSAEETKKRIDKFI